MKTSGREIPGFTADSLYQPITLVPAAISPIGGEISKKGRVSGQRLATGRPRASQDADPMGGRRHGRANTV